MIGGGIAGIAGLAQIELRTHSILRIETQVHGQCLAQASQREKSRRDGNAAQRDLRREQDIAKRPAASCVGLASAALNRVDRIGLEYLPQWHHPEQNAGEHRDKERHQDQGWLRHYYEELDSEFCGWMPA